MFIEPTYILGSLRGSLGTYGLTQKLCLKTKTIYIYGMHHAKKIALTNRRIAGEVNHSCIIFKFFNHSDYI